MDITLDKALLVFPGLVGLAVYRGLRDRNTGDNSFILGAFVVGYTLFGNLVAGLCMGFNSLSDPMTGGKLAVSLTASIAAAGLTAAAANMEWLYRLAERLRITRRAGEHSPWDHVFRSLDSSWLRIRFKDGRVLVGEWLWAGHGDGPPQLFVTNAIWYETDGEYPVLGLGVLLTNLNEVLGIDFIEGT